ncbi:hypothetical protein [Psychrobacillus sp. FSL K6-1267]|uniref:hypothetical protein n=1 Tax=Psychrobacillus sp. FSL K6-1267 TaxID=2921543 RepID=UPI0030F6EE7C
MTKMLDYFKELKEQITNKELWDKNQFYIYDYEAGSGKSTNTFQFVGDMTKTQPYRVLYVQRFLKDDELAKTVATINVHAGRRVAETFTGEDAKKVKRRGKAKEAQVLCITHKMYISFCKGNHEEFWKDRNILIIDEYPDFLERVTVSKDEIGYMWMMEYLYKDQSIKTLVYKLRKSLMETEINRKVEKGNELILVEFDDREFCLLRDRIPSIIDSVSGTKEKEILGKIEQVLTNGCYFYEGAFHTFNNKIQMLLLDNNIILDANGFDYRYSLSKKYHVKQQPKIYDYSPSTLNHIEIKTSKKELSSQINLPEKTFHAILPEEMGKTLFISDKENKAIIEKKLTEYLLNRYDSEKVQAMMNEKFKIDYFGNIIGVNSYRDFDNVVIMKTPNFDYLAYALTYMYYRMNDQQSVGNVSVFQHEEVEKIRKTAIAGEIYQAIKRVNRDNSRVSNMYVLTDNQDVVDFVVNQLPGIQYKKTSMQANNKSDTKSRTKTVKKFDQQVEGTIRAIMDAKRSGAICIQKKAIREEIGISDKSNFSKVMKAIQGFLEVNGFDMNGQKIILR